ncbi:OsmC family protein [Brevibacillus laterosporus]|uniref:OsmC family protein n=1 Tax=Brevibacillus laterosporus TaxID=1465 RepID=A0AAP8U3F5_BRELA|nr:OsmC family protein [Brevibacillus laterosporus]MCR8980796.1 OsmC family protein [Brevibacillus laterosporus]MCZ0807951.1 OsmC family protein [Brevibacillus laterosporus]MCZ0826158.1 OsmC family protein [Brevibacillus laterosporus]MCZ0852279.1 OsmC family protein [Brevibacillus laterosporus]PPA91194.1 osmotically inducible protein C [Brevibacillus laterosporus]
MQFTQINQTLQTSLPFENLTISSDRQSGFKPIDLLVSAIAGCSQIVFTRILEKQRISYDSLTLQIDAVQSEDAPNPLTKVSLVYNIAGSDLVQEKLEKALRLIPSNCTIIQSLNPNIEVVEQVIISKA